MTRERALRGARVAFVVLAVACAWWGFRGRWAEVGSALAATDPLRLAASVGCVAAGLVLTGLVWRLLLARLGSEITAREAGAVFLVGQLGKYVPGSVWSVAVQADLGRRYAVPVRRSVTASTLFLLVHTATGLLAGGLLTLGGAFGSDLPDGPVTSWPAVVTLVGATALAPPLLRRGGDLLAGHGGRMVLTLVDVARMVVLMAAVWTSYGAGLLLLTGPDGPGLGAAVAAFALAHAAGVLLVVAPAGVGAREAVLVALLAPAIGVPAAAAAAVLARVAHALADFLVAGAAAAWARGTPATRTPEPARGHGQ